MILNEFNKLYVKNLEERILPSANKARKYLNRRGISDKTIKFFKLGFCTGNDYPSILVQGFNMQQLLDSQMVRESKRGEIYDFFSQRITIPLLSLEEAKNFTSRAVGTNHIPHLHRAGRFNIAFNHDVLYESDNVIITESPIDTMTLEEHHYPSIALLGANKITRKVLSDLKGLKIYICFDHDPNEAGQIKARRLAQKLIDYDIPSSICDLSIPFSESRLKIDVNSFFTYKTHKHFNRVISRAKEFIGVKREQKTYHHSHDGLEDIINLISQYIEVGQSNGRYTCLCPFHKDSKPSFVIYPKTNSFYCFGCNKGGGVIEFKKMMGIYE